MTLTEPMAEVSLYGWQYGGTKGTMARVKWCEDHIGEYGCEWFYVWGDGEGEWSTWYFVDEKHATMFALKFS
jgi:hypothetical protein